MIDVKLTESTINLDTTNGTTIPRAEAMARPEGLPEAEAMARPEAMAQAEPAPQVESRMPNLRRASHNPATGGLLGHVPLVGRDGIDAAVQAAREAQAIWGEWSPSQRAASLLQFRDALVEDLEAVATLISMEQGKPLAEAMSLELLSVLPQLKWLTTEGVKMLEGHKARLFHPLFTAKEGHYHFEPLGVIAIISPWNYPFCIPVIQMLTALMAGNGVVLKPSPYVPLIGQKIAELARRTNMPAGLLNVLHVEDSDAPHLTSHPGVDKIIFTGSVATGRQVMASAAQIPTPVVLELGGKDAAIVAPDADLKRAVPGILWYAMANTGQSCAGIERAYVHADIYSRFVADTVALAKTLTIGPGIYQDSQIGPLTNEEQLNIVEAQVEEAKAKGAKVLTGGYRLPMEGYFYAATILVDVTPDMDIMQQETFGPVLPIIKVNSMEEAIQAANNSKFGLTGSIWTTNKEQGIKLAKQMRVGAVNINDHTFHIGEPGAACGGVGYSGFGRTHGEFGLLEMVNRKLITTDMRQGVLEPSWYPYNEKTTHFLRHATYLLYGTNKRRHWALLSLMLNPRTWKRVNLVRFIAAIRKWL